MVDVIRGSDVPEAPEAGTTQRVLLEAAVAAPSVHNTQPWLFLLRPDAIDLYADPSRQLRRADRTGRELLVSCGAALFNLRVAAEHVGLRSQVSILPDRDDPTLVAQVSLARRDDSTSSLGTFYTVIPRRHTNRLPFRDEPVPEAAVSRLREAATLENAALRCYSDADEVARLVSLMHDAEFEERLDPVIGSERAAWVGAERSGDGVPSTALGPRPADFGSPFRDLGPLADPGRDSARFEATPTVAVLSTAHDLPIDWVRAGQALQRVLLVATSEGLAASFMNQPLGHPDLRWLVRSPMTGGGHPQMLMRIGFGDEVPATPRRPLRDVLLRRG